MDKQSILLKIMSDIIVNISYRSVNIDSRVKITSKLSIFYLDYTKGEREFPTPMKQGVYNKGKNIAKSPVVYLIGRKSYQWSVEEDVIVRASNKNSHIDAENYDNLKNFHPDYHNLYWDVSRLSGLYCIMKTQRGASIQHHHKYTKRLIVRSESRRSYKLRNSYQRSVIRIREGESQN